jgi:peptidoglycan/LPS O-acetylase OafA/YrhL
VEHSFQLSDKTHVKKLDKPIGIAGYLPALTGFRAIAAILVFCNHFYGHWYQHRCETGYQDFLAYTGGRGGVTLFFALSGFLIAKIYYPRFARGEIRFGEYWIRRFSRIWPPFFFLLAIKTIMAYFGTGEWHDQLYKPDYIWQILSNLTLTQAFFPRYIWSGLSPSWSLTVEECFYLTAPFVFLGLARLKDLKWSTVFLCGVTALYIFLGHFLHQLQIGDLLRDYREMYDYNIFGKFGIFAAGIVTALWILKNEGEKLKRYQSELWFLSGVSLIFLYLWILYVNRFYSSSDIMLWLKIDYVGGVGASVLIFGVFHGSSLAKWILGNPVVEYLGRISYITYLLGESYFAYNIAGRANDWTPWFQSFWMTYIAFVIVSATIYEFVEKPAHKFLLRKFISK